MDDSVIWSVALWTGVLGLLLLFATGILAVYLNIRARRARDGASADKSQARAESTTSADKSRARADLPNAEQTTASGPWNWIKAWIFAVVHAGTVSLVMGGITFFEDLARASEEIQHTGTVTFPKQLLPGTLSEPASRKRLSQPSGDILKSGGHPSDYRRYEATDDETEDPDQPGANPSAAGGWEVVDRLDDADANSAD
jgi:hypothetical protein